MSLGLREHYRDRWLLVVEKPHGVPAQPPQGGGDGQDVFSRVRRLWPDAALLHRLDTPASGLMLLSLSREANAPLTRAFRGHRVERVYLAVVLGSPPVEGRWDAPVEGREAGTRWVRERTSGDLSLLRVSLETGRTHQIRLHAALAGHPILGDRRHGGAAGRAWPRLALHATRLALRHPITRQALDLHSPVPADLAPLVDRLG